MGQLLCGQRKMMISKFRKFLFAELWQGVSVLLYSKSTFILIFQNVAYHYQIQTHPMVHTFFECKFNAKFQTKSVKAVGLASNSQVLSPTR